MCAVPNPNAPAVDCRFLFNSGAPAGVFENALRADVRAARLSPAFRAYYRLRSLIPMPVRQLLQRYRPIEQTSDWYLPRQFTSALAEVVEAAGDSGVPTIHP